VRTHKPALTDVEEMHWLGPTEAFVAFTEAVEQPALLQRAQTLALRGL
jgi:hypothetical protein